ncbi:MAG TPA: cobyrinate a,c-diamide synthase, partial [Streptomyces sp.]|nr:cobyrinate a,c-diamide synthase [Streptomyces sp.]
DPGVRVAGVILNKVGSHRHEELLRDALDSAGVPVLGVLRRAAPAGTPGRHLGLVPVAERRADAVAAVAAMAALVAGGCDLEALVGVARGAGTLECAAWDADAAVARSAGTPGAPGTAVTPSAADAPVAWGGATAAPPGTSGAPGAAVAQPAGTSVDSGAAVALPTGVPVSSSPPSRPVPGPGAAARGRPPGRHGPGRARRSPLVALAGGPAFSFSYAEHAELLTASGAEVAVFDPLRDEELPAGTSGLVIGGGFPEVYAAELAANEPLRRAVAGLALSGAPVAAECAGLLYLCRELDGLPMCGVLDAAARMTERLTLGYRDAVAVGDSALAAAGTRMRGHEFHRTAVEPGAGAEPAWGVLAPGRRVEGFVQRGVHASYLHTHWASEPGVARRFVERCRTS